MNKKHINSFKRPTPSIKPKKTGLDLIDSNFNVPLKSFHDNVHKIRVLLSQNPEDKNIYRYSIVLICGALDKYMHDIVKVMILQIFKGNTSPGKNFDEFLIPISLLDKFDKSSYDIEEKEKILNESLYEIISGFTILKSYAIERNMNYIINFNIWKAILPRMMMRFKELNSVSQLKKFIDNLVERRNIIAHELDFMPNSQDKYDITYKYVENVIDVIQYFVESINYQIRDSLLNYKGDTEPKGDSESKKGD
ncbi:HEPN domain-containing protein [Peptostreptococcus faecalis]|uniref:HEPN domain-containing protein n=1 Tax=Peptostreptococcus faecalis TaxID=2045015 RepID=UPI000C7B62E0|nr:HEPN domain-containing protein [Peptostreptococcus faecalis]